MKSAWQSELALVPGLAEPGSPQRPFNSWVFEQLMCFCQGVGNSDNQIFKSSNSRGYARGDRDFSKWSIHINNEIATIVYAYGSLSCQSIEFINNKISNYMIIRTFETFALKSSCNPIYNYIILITNNRNHWVIYIKIFNKLLKLLQCSHFYFLPLNVYKFRYIVRIFRRWCWTEPFPIAARQLFEHVNFSSSHWSEE